MLMTLKPIKIGKPTRCDYDDIRLQDHYGVIFGMDRESYIHTQVMDFISKPICNRQYITSPFCLCCQNNLSTEKLLRLKKNDFMTT